MRKEGVLNVKLVGLRVLGNESARRRAQPLPLAVPAEHDKHPSDVNDRELVVQLLRVEVVVHRQPVHLEDLADRHGLRIAVPVDQQVVEHDRVPLLGRLPTNLRRHPLEQRHPVRLTRPLVPFRAFFLKNAMVAAISAAPSPHPLISFPRC